MTRVESTNKKLREALRQISDNANLVLNSQPGDERQCLEEIAFVADVYLSRANCKPTTHAAIETILGWYMGKF